MGNSIRLTLTSPTQTFTHTTDDSSVKIGRSLKCPFNIPKEDLSREHCLFEVQGDDYYVTDLGSTNGVSVDGKRIPVNTKVKISKESTVVLSSMYTLKINAFEIKTKSDIMAPKVNTEIETVTFQLDLPGESRKERLKKKIMKNIDREMPAKSSSQSFENVKMIAGFVVILAFVIYQALGE